MDEVARMGGRAVSLWSRVQQERIALGLKSGDKESGFYLKSEGLTVLTIFIKEMFSRCDKCFHRPSAERYSKGTD